MSSIEEIRKIVVTGGGTLTSVEAADLLAELDRLTAELAAERAAHELERRAHERTWKHKAKMIDERDAAIRERDERPNISRADAEKYQRVRRGQVRPYGDPYRAWSRVNEALRTHAAGVDAPVPHQVATDAALARLAAMTIDEKRQTLVNAGIVDEDGRLTAAYRGDGVATGRTEAPRVDTGCGYCLGAGRGVDSFGKVVTCPYCLGRTEAAKGGE